LKAPRAIPALVLPVEARRDFAAPRGLVCSGEGCIAEALPRTTAAACVGDVVSRHCMEALEASEEWPGLVITVFDGVTRRGIEVQSPVGPAIMLGFRVHITRNPRGSLAPEAAGLLCRLARSGGRHAVFVEGEEDMLALPLLECMPTGGLVAYGVPGRGVALVWATRERRIDAWLRHMRLQPGRALA